MIVSSPEDGEPLMRGVAPSGVLFTDGHFFRLDVGLFDLRLLLLDGKREQQNLKNEREEKEREEIVVTRQPKTSFHHI